MIQMASGSYDPDVFFVLKFLAAWCLLNENYIPMKRLCVVNI